MPLSLFTAENLLPSRTIAAVGILYQKSSKKPQKLHEIDVISFIYAAEIW